MTTYTRHTSDPLTGDVVEEQITETNMTQAELVERLSDDYRVERNFVLSDFLDRSIKSPMQWAAMTSEKQQEWLDYRQALLDIPQQSGYPLSITWPTKPAG